MANRRQDIDTFLHLKSKWNLIFIGPFIFKTPFTENQARAPLLSILSK